MTNSIIIGIINPETGIQLGTPLDMSDYFLDLERTHVRDVYENIAEHFSHTRYKAWPVVSEFVSSLQAGQVGLDVGCGNGKNMRVCSEGVFSVGFDLYDNYFCLISITNDYDRCWGLLELAQEDSSFRGRLLRGTMVSLPWRSSSQDFIMSIAALHHLSTEERRLTALVEMLRVLIDDGGRLLIYVWAMADDVQDASVTTPADNLIHDQDKQSNEKFVKRNRSSMGGGRRRMEQISQLQAGDVFVPWQKTTTSSASIFVKDNADDALQSMKRFYHLFAKGELDALLLRAAQVASVSIRIVASGYDCENWYVEAVTGGV